MFKTIIGSLCLMAVPFNAMSLTKVVDAATGDPLPKASLFDHKGAFVTITDDEGVIPEIVASAYPLTVTYMGYESGQVTSPEVRVVELDEMPFELPELNVNSAERNLLHLTAYVRDYGMMSADADTNMLLAEKIVDFVIPVRKAKFKGWEKARELASHTIVKKKTKSGNDTIIVSDALGGSNMNPVKMLKRINVPEKIIGGDATKVTLQGKYSPKETWYAVGNDYYFVKDGLADKKNHTYTPNATKALGATTDIKRAENTYHFDNVKGRDVSIEDLASFSSALEFVGRGKMYRWAFDRKSPINVNIYTEIYIIDREYLTADEAKELKQYPPSPSSVTITAPASAAPLLPAFSVLKGLENEL